MIKKFHFLTGIESLLIPSIVGLSIILIGWRADNLMKQATQEILTKDLNDVLRANVKALRIWNQGQERNAESIAYEPLVRELVAQLLQNTGRKDHKHLIQNTALQQLRDYLSPKLMRMEYFSFSIIGRNGGFIAASNDFVIGQELDEIALHRIQPILNEGRTLVSTPFIPRFPHSDSGKSKSMVVGTPIKDTAGQIVAVLGLHFHPESEFTRILSVARSGESGETYAFDKQGIMISESRFIDELKRADLLMDMTESSSVLNLDLRDPGSAVTSGYKTARPRSHLPLTEMAASAVSGHSGINVDGYRNYLGVPVIGAWTWLYDYDFGVATETAYAEAYQSLKTMRRLFCVLFGLLASYTGITLICSIVASRLQRRIHAAEMETRQLGQYTLEYKIGEGGMGPVYRARHAFMRRPTAVKLLLPGNAAQTMIKRFEEEVQLTSRLVHPNTIQIYDYGHTPDGIFYYAMEYLDGVNLKDLVQIDGAQPPGRVIHMIKQVCGSLSEAHEIGLVHRDIKPSNIIIGKRGNIYDFIKVLDFGLMENMTTSDDNGNSSRDLDIISGTPQYLAPETILNPENIDPRSDIYSLGATAYLLVTGQEVFTAKTVVDICRHHIATPPVPPSQRFKKHFDQDLENVIMKCLQKQPEMRFANVKELMVELERLQLNTPWSEDDASQWWKRFQSKTTSIIKPAAAATTHLSKTLVVNLEERKSLTK